MTTVRLFGHLMQTTLGTTAAPPAFMYWCRLGGQNTCLVPSKRKRLNLRQTISTSYAMQTSLALPVYCQHTARKLVSVAPKWLDLLI